MILVTLGTGAATFIGMVAGHTNFILVLFAAGAGFVYGMLSLRQAGVSWVGQQFIVFLLVASGFPFSPRAAAVRSGLVMAGGALQIITSSILLHLLQELRTDLLFGRALSSRGAPGVTFLRGAGRALADQARHTAQRRALCDSSRHHSRGKYRNLPPLRLRQRILDTHDRLAGPQARTHATPSAAPSRAPSALWPGPCWPASLSPIWARRCPPWPS